MQIRNPADASAVEECFKRFFEVDAADMPREIRGYSLRFSTLRMRRVRSAS